MTTAGLALLAMWLLLSPPIGPGADTVTRLVLGILCALPLLVLLVLGGRATSKWGTWVALMLIPYFALSVGSWLLQPQGRLPGILFAVLIATTFFAGIAADRQP